MKRYIVFVNGCFDILHVGHIRLLKFAKDYGIAKSSYLQCKVVVGLNSDDSIIKRKGVNRPINRISFRKEMLEALQYVDEVIVFNEDLPNKLIKKLKPDIVIKGPDYRGREDELSEELGGVPVIIVPWKKDVSTSGLIERINKL